ncbi:Protein CBG14271 [Caenorhabditis briggsae]|uniref:Protein CBG14271 n=1 Tax=Caenorhabditis briggsae TaxID=6238 RepID=A8XJN0_CAEBR|nr:Protein CBG14271 [Caenorhabditis briggsae]CAP32856.1 Protein CBG14271 [Caenorhabditis briggsae]
MKPERSRSQNQKTECVRPFNLLEQTVYRREQLEKITFAYHNLYRLHPSYTKMVSEAFRTGNPLLLWNFENDCLLNSHELDDLMKKECRSHDDNSHSNPGMEQNGKNNNLVSTLDKSYKPLPLPSIASTFMRTGPPVELLQQAVRNPLQDQTTVQMPNNQNCNQQIQQAPTQQYYQGIQYMSDPHFNPGTANQYYQYFPTGMPQNHTQQGVNPQFWSTAPPPPANYSLPPPNMIPPSMPIIAQQFPPQQNQNMIMPTTGNYCTVPQIPPPVYTIIPPHQNYAQQAPVNTVAPPMVPPQLPSQNYQPTGYMAPASYVQQTTSAPPPSHPPIADQPIDPSHPDIVYDSNGFAFQRMVVKTTCLVPIHMVSQFKSHQSESVASDLAECNDDELQDLESEFEDEDGSQERPDDADTGIEDCGTLTPAGSREAGIGSVEELDTSFLDDTETTLTEGTDADNLESTIVELEHVSETPIPTPMSQKIPEVESHVEKPSVEQSSHEDHRQNSQEGIRPETPIADLMKLTDNAQPAENPWKVVTSKKSAKQKLTKKQKRMREAEKVKLLETDDAILEAALNANKELLAKKAVSEAATVPNKSNKTNKKKPQKVIVENVMVSAPKPPLIAPQLMHRIRTAISVRAKILERDGFPTTHAHEFRQLPPAVGFSRITIYENLYVDLPNALKTELRFLMNIPADSHNDLEQLEDVFINLF